MSVVAVAGHAVAVVVVAAAAAAVGFVALGKLEGWQAPASRHLPFKFRFACRGSSESFSFRWFYS